MDRTSSSDEPVTLEDSPALQGEIVAFTGTLASMTHQQASEFVRAHGGSAGNHVSRQTTMLVVGQEGWPLDADGTVSRKLQQVDEWNDSGLNIRLVSESEWLHLIGLDERIEDVHRIYTPAMLSSLLRIPVSLIRRWERLGLIRPVRRVFRLPYFDFQEVTSVRKLSELLACGVEPEELERQLGRMRHLLDGTERSIAQLNILVRDSRIVYRDRFGLVQPATGQRLLDFEPSLDPASPDAGGADAATVLFHENADEIRDDHRMQWTAGHWFDEGCRLSDLDEAQAAVEAFRLSLTTAGRLDLAGSHGEPLDTSEVNFHLAEALYRTGNINGAIERYYGAIEQDANFLEAWTQLGCLLCETDQNDAALEAFRIALEIHPEYPDANLHVADLLASMGRTREAVPHWKTYLAFDLRGPWADRARQRLDEALAPQPT